MAVIWMDDPSFYNDSLAGVRYSVYSGVTISVGNGRFGNNSWRATGGAPNYLVRQLTSNPATGVVAISFKFNGPPSFNGTTGGIVGFWDSGNLQCDVRVNSSGNIYVTRNGTQIGSMSSNFIVQNVWYRIEFQCTIDPSAGAIEVRINGSSTGWIPSTTGLNTRATANSSFNQIAAINASGGTMFANVDFNDFVCTDNNSTNAGFLGDKRCYLRQPSADSSVTWTPTFAAFAISTVYVLGQQCLDGNGNVQRCTVPGTSGGSAPTWATNGGSTTTTGGATFVVEGSGPNPGAHNWMAVSEVPADDDNSYNASSTAGQVDLFSIPVLPSTLQSIVAIDNVTRVRKDDAGTRTYQSVIKSGSTQSNSASLGLSTSNVYVDQIANVDPNTGVAWTVAAANAMLVGYDEVV